MNRLKRGKTDMKITAFANFLHPQTLPMYETLYEKSGHQLTFAATEPMDEHLLKQGYPDYHELMPFVYKLYEEPDMSAKAKELAADSDVLIYGHCPSDYFDLCVSTGKPVFRLSQHIYRDGKTYPLKWRASYFLKHTLKLSRKPVYLLCIGTYTAHDFSLSGAYKNRMFEFGEFTPVAEYDLDTLLKAKQKDPVKIVWANDFRSRCHPETAAELAERLSGESCLIELYGTGRMAQELKEKTEHLANVTVIEDDSLFIVDRALTSADIFLVTGDYHDGWGNILNRAMNHACACVVSTAVGASKMIGRNENGLLYEYGNMEDLESKVRMLINDSGRREALSRAAFAATRDVWNGISAGGRLYELMEAVRSGKPSPFAEGICAPAMALTQEEMARRAAL